MRFFNHKSKAMSVDDLTEIQRKHEDCKNGDLNQADENEEEFYAGNGGGGELTRKKSANSINSKTSPRKHKHKNFIKKLQLFHHKSKENAFISRGLWSVIDTVDGVENNSNILDDLSSESSSKSSKESRKYHNLHYPFLSKKEPKEPSKPEIPIILLNGIELSDSSFEDDDDDDDEDLGKNKIEDFFDRLDTKCSVSGEGIFGGHENEPNTFYAETKKDFDKSKFHVSIKGPKQKPIRTESVLVDDKTCQFTYWPRRTGYYTLYIMWGEKHVVGSPFRIIIN